MTKKSTTPIATNAIHEKRSGYTIVTNTAIRDNELTLQAKGLYAMVASYITLSDAVTDFTLSKEFLSKHCWNGRKSFDSAWRELKKHGYLTATFRPGGSYGAWLVDYTLLDTPRKDGIHTIYLNKAGVVTHTNLSRSTPSTLVTRSHIERWPTCGSDGDGDNGDGDTAKGGSKINPKINTMDNDHQSILRNKSGCCAPGSQISGPCNEEIEHLTHIPYSYIKCPDSMQQTIRYLCEWEHRHAYPFLLETGMENELKMRTYDFCIDTLVDMACAKGTRTYRGALITASKVVDILNRICQPFEEGALTECMDTATDALCAALDTRIVTDVQAFSAAVIWSHLVSFGVPRHLTPSQAGHQDTPSSAHITE